MITVQYDTPAFPPLNVATELQLFPFLAQVGALGGGCGCWQSLLPPVTAVSAEH